MSVTPNFQTFSTLAQKHPGKLIPLTRSFLADSLTPVGAFRRIPVSDYAFLLESVERGERIGRYSFVGSSPEVIFRGHVLPKPGYTMERPASSTTKGESGATQTFDGDPLVALEKYLAENTALSDVSGADVPPFSGGGVGYLGYDVIRLVEPRLFKNPPAKAGIENLPDLLVPIYRTILAFDHVKNTLTIVHHVRAEGDLKALYDAALATLENVVKHLSAPMPESLDEIAVLSNPSTENLKSNMTPEQYMGAVEKAKEYIASGDIIQVVLSQRMSRDTKAHPFEIYRNLRAINPSPYMFYLHMGKTHIVGSSPEVMVRVENGLITVRPIAGTRPRGKTPEDDARLAKELLADPKELAEHVMLLDLGRNDVGRVADYKTVNVTEKMTVEYYSHVMHIVSNVQGRMSPELNAFRVFGSCFPAGTVSGAPKIRAMEIIDELEPDRRGAYAGAVGVVDFLGNLNTAIALRTFVIQEKNNGIFTAYLQAGAGIVADSVPKMEYEETLNKARGLLRALAAAEQSLK